MRPDKWKLHLHGKEMSVLTALKEMGGSNRNVLALLNALYRLPKGLQPLGYRALWGAIQRSNFLLSKTKLQHQASNNRPAWVQARFNACYQLAVRFGLDIPTDTNGAKVTCLPAVDKERIKQKGLQLSIHQIGWWDEKHIPQVIGSKLEFNYQFGQDEYDVYDHEREPEEKEVIRKNLKFTAEARFSFGCFVKKNKNGEEIGRRMQHFNYSGKTIIGLSKYRNDVDAEIDRAKHLSPAKLKSQKWVGIRKCLRGSLYENDLLREVKGISKSMEMKINNCGIMNVMEFSIIPEEDIREVAKALKKLNQK
jgi:hypothetical protein